MDWVAEASLPPQRDLDAYSEDASSEQDYDFEDEQMAYENEEADDLEGNNGETVQSYSYDRAMVARANGIGVYSSGGDSGMEYFGKLGITTNCQPKNMRLYDSESKLLYQDDDSTQISVFDMNKEKIVEEWEVGNSKDIMNFTGETKNS